MYQARLYHACIKRGPRFPACCFDSCRWQPEGVAGHLAGDVVQPCFGSFLPDAAGFDAAAFGLSEAEALLMDPQQRLLMEAYTRAAAGLHTAAVDAASVGVYVGISAVDYNKLTSQLQLSPTPYTATGSLSLSVAAGRLSYSFGLSGPALAIDTACSSSLVAVHAAVSGLRLAHSRAAAVGGVNLQLIPDTPALFLKAGAAPGLVVHSQSYRLIWLSTKNYPN